MPVRVLLADDDPLARELSVAIVSGDDSLELVATAEDADEAIEMAELHRPEVAVLDWSMPGGGGTRAARSIRASCPETRVLALTSSDATEVADGMREAGAGSLLVKGGPPAELIEAILETARPDP